MAIVTIDGHIGAGAADLGKRIAELLGCDFYDRLLVVGASKRMGARLEAMIERQRRPPRISDRLWRLLPFESWRPQAVRISSSQMRQAFSEYIRDVAEAGDAVFVHRAACLELRGKPEVVRVGVFAPWAYRVRRLMTTAGQRTRREASSALVERERAQIDYFFEHFGAHPHDRSLYDVEVTVSAIGDTNQIFDSVARQVARMAVERAGRPPLAGEASRV